MKEKIREFIRKVKMLKKYGLHDACSIVYTRIINNTIMNVMSKIVREKQLDELGKKVLNKRVIVFAPSIDWFLPLFQRPQQLAMAYSKKKDTFVVYFSKKTKFDKFPLLSKVHDNCWVMDEKYIKEIDGALNGAKQVILSISWVTCKRYAEIIRCDKLIYEYIDELSLFRGYDQQMELDHIELLQKEDVAVATATKLYNSIKSNSKNAILSTNGVDYEFFHNAKNIAMNKRICNKVKKYSCVLGYYGALASWFDYDLVAEVARRKPDWCWVLVGYDYDFSIRKSGILKIPNIIHINARPYQELPSFLTAFDIATIPFIINDITLSTSPVKLFEYMAGGKPILCSNMPECLKYQSVKTYSSADDFIAKSEELLALKRNDPYWALLEKEALENTWDAKTDEILKALNGEETGGPVID